MKVFGAKERFGSLTFAKRGLVCRAKGNVPNVGWLSPFFSCGSAKKLNLFSFNFSFSFLILKPFFFCHFRCRCLFLRLVGNGWGCDQWGSSGTAFLSPDKNDPNERNRQFICKSPTLVTPSCYQQFFFFSFFLFC